MKEISSQLLLIWEQMSWLKRGAMIAFILLIALCCLFVLRGKKQPLPEVIVTENRERGFELFDSGTWIKGEKELQVLEIRALKGQLEADLASFDTIKEARVILDLAENRSLRSKGSEASASVILTLEPSVVITRSQLGAIANHLAGAVKGLKPSRIAISDTTGKLYKTLNDTDSEPMVWEKANSVAETLQANILTLLHQVVGQKHAHCSVVKNAQDAFEVGVVLDANRFPEGSLQPLQSQIDLLMHPHPNATLVLDHLPFYEEPSSDKVMPRMSNVTTWYTWGVLLPGIGLLIFYFMKKKSSKPVVEKEASTQNPQVDLTHLAHSMDTEDPEAIAAMLVMLPKRRGEEILAHLSKENQMKVQRALAEIEKGRG